MSGAGAKLDLSHIVFIGRTFDEYISMFNLTREELRGLKILDCPAGACSFTALANREGADATAADIAYQYDYELLRKKGTEDLEIVIRNVEKVRQNYMWSYFRSVSELKSHRIKALTDCVSHMKQAPERYVPSTLPVLPFGDKQFDMTLSAHFLFLYEDRLDYDFHLQTIKELLRVSKREVRIFPLVNLACGRYGYLDDIMDYLKRRGCTVDEAPVSYEFQRGANSMLRIRGIENIK